MSDINIGVDASQVVKAESALDGMEAAFGKLVAKIIREEKQLSAALKRPWEAQAKALDELIKKQTDSAATATRANQTIINSLLGVTNQYKSAEASAETFVQSLRNQEAAARAFGLSVAANAGVNQTPATQGGAGFGALEAEIERLSQKYNTVYASSQLYEKSLNELESAHRLGVIGVKQYESAVESLNAEFASFSAGSAGLNNRFAQLDNQMQASQKGVKNFQLFVQQAGFQVGDFAVQVASGQSAIVAFTQQATQLAGFIPGIGYWGAIGGAVLAVAGAFGTYFFRASEAADATNRLTEAQKALVTAGEETQSKLDQLRFGVDTEAEAAILVERNRLQDEYNTKVQALATYQQTTTQSLDRQQIVTAEMVADIQTTVDAYEAIRSQLESHYRLQQSLSIVEQLKANRAKSNEESLARAAIQLQVQEDKANAIYNAMVKHTAALMKNQNLARQLDMELGKGAASALKLAGIDIAKPISAAAKAAASLAGNLGIALNAAISLQNQRDSLEYGGGRQDPRKFMTGGPKSFSDTFRPFEFDPPSGGSGGSGGGSGGGSDPNAGKLEALIQSLQTERETIDIWYEESKALLQASSDAELAIVGGKNAAMIRLEEELQEKLKGIKEAGAKSQLETYLSGGAEILGALGAFNDKALKISKVFAAAEALVSTYQGAAAELRKGTFGFASAAAVIAKGLGFVAAIKGVGGGGGGSGGSSGGSGGSASTINTAAPATPQTVYIDSIDPEALYSGATLVNLFDAFYNENDRRGKVFIVGR